MSRSPAESDGRCARPGLDHRTGSAPAVGASRGAPGDELSVKAAPARSPAGRPVRANIPRSGGTRLAPGPAPAAGQRHRRPRFCSSPERPCARPGASSAQPPPLSRCPRPPPSARPWPQAGPSAHLCPRPRALHGAFVGLRRRHQFLRLRLPGAAAAAALGRPQISDPAGGERGGGLALPRGSAAKAGPEHPPAWELMD